MRQRELAKKLGRHESFVSNLLAGRIKNVTLPVAETLTEVFGHDPVWWMKATPEELKQIIKQKDNPKLQNGGMACGACACCAARTGRSDLGAEV